MSSRTETAALRAEFMEAFDRIGSVKPAAEEVGADLYKAYYWVKRAGKQTKRLDHPKKAPYLKLRAEGMSRDDAVAEMSISYHTGYRWDKGIRQLAVGVVYPDGRITPPPPKKMMRGKIRIVQKPLRGTLPIPEQVSDRFLSLRERECIADLRLAGKTCAEIARRIGRHRSTVKRELDRNCIGDEYFAYHSHHNAAENRRRPKVTKLSVNDPLRSVVNDGLRNHHSPEQISNRLRMDYPDDTRMRVSHETIYQSVFVQGRGKLNIELKSALRSGRVHRKSHKDSGKSGRRFKEEMVMISDRPADIEDRSVPGHWEGDLIIGAHGKSAIGTLVERKTGFTMLLHLPECHDAATVSDAIIKSMNTLPESLRGSLTWDQGVEMAEHLSVKMETGMDVYFCDPHSPWQRGTNENTNGLLRQYFPKGTDLSVHSPEDLEYVANELNGRPRKRLEWFTPAECLREALQA